MLARLALGTALEHAVPIIGTWDSGPIDPVARYMHYEAAYMAGDLDPVVLAWACF